MSQQPSGASSIRAFLALPVAESIRARIADTIASLSGRVQGVRWASASAVHLTLRFLGGASLERLQRLSEPLRRAAASCPASEARFAGLGTFPERGSPRVIWLGVALRPELQTLQAACEAAAVGAGFEPETRPFRAHLTLGRWRERARQPVLPPEDLGTCRLDSLVLFRSELKPSGAIHTPLSTFALGG